MAIELGRGDALLAKKFGLPVYASRDWHPREHCSFAAQGGPAAALA